jgi:hypothetical protein
MTRNCYADYINQFFISIRFGRFAIGLSANKIKNYVYSTLFKKEKNKVIVYAGNVGRIREKRR